MPWAIGEPILRILRKLCSEAPRFRNKWTGAEASCHDGAVADRLCFGRFGGGEMVTDEPGVNN